LLCFANYVSTACAADSDFGGKIDTDFRFEIGITDEAACAMRELAKSVRSGIINPFIKQKL
jgi:hypothetical protein